MRISGVHYNSPVILTYSLLSALVMLLVSVFGERLHVFFILHGDIQWDNPVHYLSMFTYAMGHANWAHLIGNFSLILVVGPMLEEKYGAKHLVIMMLLTVFITAILNAIFFQDNNIGASGVVFMLILLSSFASFRRGYIPLTFILVFLLYIGKEAVDALKPDTVSQFAHIIGGSCGAVFGFLNNSNQNSAPREKGSLKKVSGIENSNYGDESKKKPINPLPKIEDSNFNYEQ